MGGGWWVVGGGWWVVGGGSWVVVRLHMIWWRMQEGEVKVKKKSAHRHYRMDGDWDYNM